MVISIAPYLRGTGMNANIADAFNLADILPTRRNILREVEREIFTSGNSYAPFTILEDTPQCTKYLLTISPPSQYNVLEIKMREYFKSVGDVETIATSFGNVRATFAGMRHGVPKTGADGKKYVPFTIQYRFELPR